MFTIGVQAGREAPLNPIKLQKAVTKVDTSASITKKGRIQPQFTFELVICKLLQQTSRAEKV